MKPAVTWSESIRVITPEARWSDGNLMTNRAVRRRLKTHLDLLAALRRELAQVGANEITVGRITERADVAIGTFYNHFTDKTAALEALADVEAQALRLSVAEMIGDEMILPRSLTAVEVALIQHGAVDPEWLASMAAIIDSRYFPTPEVAIRLYGLAMDNYPDTGPVRQTWHVRVAIALQCELVRSLHAGDLGSSMPKRIEFAVSSMLGATGFSEATIKNEIDWANQIPIPTEWPTSEVVLIDTWV